MSKIKAETEAEKKKKKINIFKAFKKLAPEVIKATPILFASSAILSIFHGIFFGVETMYRQKFFDKASKLAAGEVDFNAAVIALLLLALMNVICQVLNGVANYIPEIMLTKAGGKMSLKINEKIGRLSPIDFEDTDKLDDINKAYQGQNNAVSYVFILITILTFYVPYFIFMSWYLFTLKPILALSIVLVFIPTVFTQIIRTKVFAKLEDKSAPIRREYDYYENCIIGREYYKETRLLGAFGYFKRLYVDTLKLLQDLSFKAIMKTNFYELLMRMVTVAGYYSILYMLFDSLMKQEITIGAFAAVFSSIGMLYGIMEEVVCRHIGNLAQNMGTIQNYINFLDMPECRVPTAELPETFDINLENVSFSYPKAEKPSLKKVSLNIKNGETVAIVGENGSGKSTLIRLITGLYLPNEGTVHYGNVTSEEASVYPVTSAVFQKYQHYQMTLRENICISSVERKSDESVLDSVCEMSGTDTKDLSFTDGYDTMLSREFDGVDLSGGQWQRIAIARGFYRINSLIVLDEPTAAIDPYEETRIYNRFAEISRNKTALIVTHRLGSVKLANRIIVMKDGKAVEIGSHSDLMELHGEYERLYKSQEQWYSEEATLY